MQRNERFFVRVGWCCRKSHVDIRKLKQVFSRIWMFHRLGKKMCRKGQTHHNIDEWNHTCTRIKCVLKKRESDWSRKTRKKTKKKKPRSDRWECTSRKKKKPKWKWTILWQIIESYMIRFHPVVFFRLMILQFGWWFFFLRFSFDLLHRKCGWFKKRAETQVTITDSKKRELSTERQCFFFPFRHVFLFRWNKLNGKYVSISACGDDGLVGEDNRQQKRDTTKTASSEWERVSVFHM